MPRNSKVLVTGAGGFVGANLARELLSRGCEVHVIVREGSEPWRLKDVWGQMKVHRLDLFDSSAVWRVISQVKPQHVFHLAAFGGYPFQKDARRIVESNILGTWNLLEALAGIDYKSFVCAGSSSEYGYKRKPMKETDLLEPAHFYAAAKASSSLLCQTFARVYGKPAVVLRLFSIYGPYEEPTRFIPVAISNILNDRPLKIVPGKESRDFVYVDDAVEAFIKAAESPKASGGIYNVCSGKQTRISDAAALLIKAAGRKVPIERGAYAPRTWDSTFWVGSNSAAKKAFGWSPRTKLSVGFSKTVDWLSRNQELYGKSA